MGKRHQRAQGRSIGYIARRRNESRVLVLLTLDDGVYLLSYMRSEDMERAHEVVEQSKHEIDTVHQQFKKDNWVRGSTTELELLVDLAVDEDK